MKDNKIVQWVLLILEEGVKLVPGLYTELAAIFSSSTEPTAEQWAAHRARILAKRYEDYDPGFVPPPPKV